MTSNVHISLQVALTLYWLLLISTTARYCLVGRCLMQHSSPHLRGSPENRNMCSIHGCAFSAVGQLGYVYWTQHIIELVDFTCRNSVDTQYMIMQKKPSQNLKNGKHHTIHFQVFHGLQDTSRGTKKYHKRTEPECCQMAKMCSV